jgi:uncharacterized RDD family membrane protein YckC
VDERTRNTELARLEADFQRGAISAEDYERFAARLGAPQAAPTWTPAPAAVASRGPELASWGRRVAAKLIDWAVVVGVGIAAALTSAPFATETGELGSVGVVVVVAWILFAVLSPWLMVAIWGQTLGKMALGIKVVTDDAGRVGYLRALGRYFTEVVLGVFYLPLAASYLWPLWDGQRQTLHDKAARTVVTRV